MSKGLVTGDTPILDHTRDMRPELVSFSRPKNLPMGVNFCLNLDGHCIDNSTWEWVAFVKLNSTCCNLVNFGSRFIVHSLRMGLFLSIDRPTLVCRWVNFPIVWPHTHVQTKLKWPPGGLV